MKRNDFNLGHLRMHGIVYWRHQCEPWHFMSFHDVLLSTEIHCKDHNVWNGNVNNILTTCDQRTGILWILWLFATR